MDDTKGKPAEQMRRPTERFAQATIDALTAHICVLDKTGVILAVNKAWREFARDNGASGNVAEGADYLAECERALERDAEEAAAFVAGIREVIQGGREEFSLEYPCHSPGEQRWFIGRVTRFGGAGPVRLVVAHENITARRQLESALWEAHQRLEQRVRERTSELAAANEKLLAEIAERKRAEEELRREKRMVTAILNASTEAIMLLDREGTILTANEAMLRRLNRKEHEFLERNALDFLSQDLARSWRERIDEVCRSGKPARFEDEREGVLLDNSIYPVVDEKGDVTGVAVFSSDITHRKRVENALRESSQFNQQIIDSVQEGIIVYGPDLRYRVWNPFMERLTGMPARAVLGKLPLEVFPLLGEAGVTESVERVLAAEAPSGIEFSYFFLQAGRRVWVEHASAPLRNTKGRIVGVIATARDITWRKEAEEALRRSEKARAEAEKLAATGRLAARIAHEINNPLAGIGNAFQLFKDAIPKDRPEYRYVERTEKEIQRVAQTVRLMYDLHRPNQERETEVQIDETVREVVMMLEPLRRRYAAQVEILSPVPVVRARVPEGSLRQILFTLLANAIEASPAQGAVRIGLAVEDQELVVSIADQGDGIPEQLRDRIFEPFFSTKIGKGNEGGLGLGLSTAKQLTEVLGGRLDYQSDLAKGTVFRVHLPLARIHAMVW